MAVGEAIRERVTHARPLDEIGDDVVMILEGEAVEADVSEKKLRAKLDRECKRKYNMPLLVMPESICYRVRPRIVLAWLEKEFPFNSTRWEFEAG